MQSYDNDVSNNRFQELEFLSKIDFSARSSGVSKPSVTPAPASQSHLDFQHNLEQYLRERNGNHELTTDDVCSWIKVYYLYIYI